MSRDFKVWLFGIAVGLLLYSDIQYYVQYVKPKPAPDSIFCGYIHGPY